MHVERFNFIRNSQASFMNHMWASRPFATDRLSPALFFQNLILNFCNFCFFHSKSFAPSDFRSIAILRLVPVFTGAGKTGQRVLWKWTNYREALAQVSQLHCLNKCFTKNVSQFEKMKQAAAFWAKTNLVQQQKHSQLKNFRVNEH